MANGEMGGDKERGRGGRGRKEEREGEERKIFQTVETSRQSDLQSSVMASIAKGKE